IIEAFHASVQLSKAPATWPASRLAQQTRRHSSLEKELVLDPGLFNQLLRSCPRLSHVQVLPKPGPAHNELNNYRYDVVLYVEGQRPVEPDCTWVAWQWDTTAMGLQAIRDALAEQPVAQGFRSVPNARTAADAHLLSCLEKSTELQTVADLRQ